VTPVAFLEAFASAVANDGALLLLILLILWMGARKVWIFRRELDRVEEQLTDERVDPMCELNELRSEKDQWRAAALWTMGHPSYKERPPDLPENLGDDD
jgi:hypothetical protein